MKKFTLILAVVCFAVMANGQSIPNWTKTSTPGSPLNGNVDYTLHDLLSAGNAVLLDFMYVNCPPCQASTPSINNLWVMYGEGAGGFYAFALDVVNSETAAQLDAFGIQYGGTYPKFIQCSSDYGYYNTYFSPNPGYVPLFILLEPNTGDPGASTVAFSQVGWGAGTAAAFENSIQTALTGMGIWPTGLAGSDPKEDGIFIYPNPVTEYFTVVLKNINEVNVEIFNTIGQKVASHHKVNQNLEVSTANYEAGIYFVRVEMEGEVETFKINVVK